MAGGVKVTWRGDQIERKIRAEMGRRVRRACAEIRRQVVKNISISARSFDTAGRLNSVAGEFPRAYNRMLARSIFDDMYDQLNGLVGVDAAGPAKKYASRLEKGGTILSHGKRMAVPVSQMAQRYRGSVRAFPKPLQLIRRPGKPDLLVEIPQTAKGPTMKRAWIIHYVLVNRVDIAPHPYMSRTANEMRPRVKQIFEEPLSL